LQQETSHGVAFAVSVLKPQINVSLGVHKIDIPIWHHIRVSNDKPSGLAREG
jgi:hypothetical protein